jgi:hypothetical protein
MTYRNAPTPCPCPAVLPFPVPVSHALPHNRLYSFGARWANAHFPALRHALSVHLMVFCSLTFGLFATLPPYFTTFTYTYTPVYLLVYLTVYNFG